MTNTEGQMQNKIDGTKNENVKLRNLSNRFTDSKYLCNRCIFNDIRNIVNKPHLEPRTPNGFEHGVDLIATGHDDVNYFIGWFAEIPQSCCCTI